MKERFTLNELGYEYDEYFKDEDEKPRKTKAQEEREERLLFAKFCRMMSCSIVKAI